MCSADRPVGRKLARMECKRECSPQISQMTQMECALWDRMLDAMGLKRSIKK